MTRYWYGVSLLIILWCVMLPLMVSVVRHHIKKNGLIPMVIILVICYLVILSGTAYGIAIGVQKLRTATPLETHADPSLPAEAGHWTSSAANTKSPAIISTGSLHFYFK